jgi:type II secretion system protein L
MTDSILLPPKSQWPVDGLAASTPVRVVAGNALPARSTLADALRNTKRAQVLLHPLDARITKVNVPRLSKDKLKQAVPLALEDRLLSDPREVSISTGERSGEALEVAFTDRAALTEVRALMRTLGGASATVAPMTAAINPKALPCAWVEGDSAVLWMGEECAVVPTAVLPAAADRAGNAGRVYGDGIEPEDLPAGWGNEFGVPPLTAARLAFEDPTQAQAAWKMWKAPLILAGLTVLAGMVGMYAYWRMLASESGALRTAINQSFTKALPVTPMTDDPVNQLKRALTTGGSGASTFERLVDASDRAAQSLPPNTVATLEFAAERATLKFGKDKMNQAARAPFEAAAKDAGLAVAWNIDGSAVLTLGPAK